MASREAPLADGWRGLRCDPERGGCLRARAGRSLRPARTLRRPRRLHHRCDGGLGGPRAGDRGGSRRAHGLRARLRGPRRHDRRARRRTHPLRGGIDLQGVHVGRPGDARGRGPAELGRPRHRPYPVVRDARRLCDPGTHRPRPAHPPERPGAGRRGLVPLAARPRRDHPKGPLPRAHAQLPGRLAVPESDVPHSGRGRARGVGLDVGRFRRRPHLRAARDGSQRHVHERASAHGQRGLAARTGGRDADPPWPTRTSTTWGPRGPSTRVCRRWGAGWRCIWRRASTKIGAS